MRNVIIICSKQMIWLENNRTHDHEKFHNFRYTLDDVAREWYSDTVVPANWNTMLPNFVDTSSYKENLLST